MRSARPVSAQRCGLRAIGLLALLLALGAAGCLTPTAVNDRLDRAQADAARARAAAEEAAGSRDAVAAATAAATAAQAFLDARKWVDAYVAAKGPGAAIQFEASLERISGDVEASRAAALRAGATVSSIDAAIRERSRVQAGGAGGGGAAGGGGY